MHHRVPRGAVPLEEYAAVVSGRLPAGRVVLLAESFSGIVALNLLRKHHAPAEKVIFVASFGRTPRRYLRLFLLFVPALAWSIPLIPNAAWRFFCLGARATPQDVARLKAVVAQANPDVIAHRLKLVASAKTADDPPIDVPAYYLQADGDRLVPHRAAEHLRRLFSHFTLLHVPGPHFLLQASPIECAQIIASIMLGVRNDTR